MKTITSNNLRVACLQMNASANLEQNLQQITAGIYAAAKAETQILLTPECALVGYPGACRDDFTEINWCSYDGLEDLVHIRAQSAGITVLLGSVSNQQGQIYNDALFCGANSTGTRYHKRCLTPFDKQHFSSGSSACCVDFNGWKLGISICYDVRFPHTWGDLVSAGADAILTIAHMAGPDPDGDVKQSIVPQHYASRAGEWATPIALCNTTHEKRWLGSNAWDARGIPISNSNTITSPNASLDIFELQKRSNFDPWYSAIHSDAVYYHQHR